MTRTNHPMARRILAAPNDRRRSDLLVGELAALDDRW